MSLIAKLWGGPGVASNRLIRVRLIGAGRFGLVCLPQVRTTHAVRIRLGVDQMARGVTLALRPG
jgi:hypothetical protein